MNGLLSYPDELYHFGIPRKSGRYPWGSGERPYQGDGMTKAERKAARKEKTRQKNISVGRERLANRIKRANEIAETDKYAKKIGWKNTEKAAQAHKRVKEIKDVSREILEDESRTAALGSHTRHARIAATSLAAASSTVLASIGTAALASDGPIWAAVGSIAGAGAAASLGKIYLNATKY